MTEQEIVDRYSTPGLKRNTVSRSTKKLNMEFDSRFNGMSRADREEFLNEYFLEWPRRTNQ